METKWTKGPWSISPSDGGHAVYKTFSGDGLTMTANVAVCPWMADLEAATDEPGESEFNAHLIAAAPSLYEALELALQALDKFSVGDDDNMVERPLLAGYAALKKARGEQQ